MERNREVRRGSAANGLSRRRPRNSFRDSPEEEGTGELQESVRLRDRAGKKDPPSRNKRRRCERLHGNRDEGGEESTEESVDEDEEEDDEEAARLTANLRKTFPSKVVRTQWKVSDEVIGVSVPRKARSASAKRSHECWIPGGGVEQIHRQSSTSPARTSAASVSPSSSNVSVRKRMKPIGTKNRPPKFSKSSIQEIEIEVAEVLYGLTRQFQAIQCPSKPEISNIASPKLDLKDSNGSNDDLSAAGRSRVSSPVPPSSIVSSPVSPSPASHLSVVPQNLCSATSQAVAPKRKRPRPVRLEEEISALGSSFRGFAIPNASVSSATKIEGDQEGSQPPKTEVSSPKLDRISGPDENGSGSTFLESPQVSTVPIEQKESAKLEKDPVPESKPLLIPETKPPAEETEPPILNLQNDPIEPKEETALPVKESPPCAKLDVDLGDVTPKPPVSSSTLVSESPREKFKIDLMAPPAKSSLDGENDGVPDLIPDEPQGQKEIIPKMEIGEGEEARTIKKQETVDVGLEEVSRHSEPRKKSQRGEECELQTQMDKERIDLHGDAERLDKDSSSKQQTPKQPKVARNMPKAPNPQDKTGHLPSSGIAGASFPLPIPVAGWPGSLPPLGFMGQPPANWSGVSSLQAVVSMDENAGSSTLQPHLLLPPPRPKRCATHFYIAQNMYYHQQLARMNPFLAAASSASMYGSKQYNLNMMPPTETSILGSPLQGTFASSNFPTAGRNMSSVQDKCHGSTPITAFTGHVSKDKTSVMISDAQRKQLILQQAPHPASTSGILPGPAILFPLNQPAARTGGAKSVLTGNAASSATPVGAAANSIMGAPVNSGSTTTVSYNYANLPTNEAQYLAILQNNGYPFPIPPTHGAAAAYRGGSHGHLGQQVSSPFFNGPFYSSQMLHPSHIQLQSQPQPIQQGQQNPSTSSGSSSSQKHQQRRLQGGSSHNFPNSKQQRQQQGTASPSPTNSHLPPQARQIDCELGTGEDSPSTADSRVSLVQKNFYNQNHSSFGVSPLAVPLPPQNFAVMSSSALGGGKQGEKQQQPPQQQQQNDPHLQFSLKGMELSPSQAFAMPFASFNGAPGLDFSSMAQNHAVFQNLPEAARHSYQIAAQVAQQNAQRNVLIKNHQVSVVTEDGKTVSDAINVAASEEEKKMRKSSVLAHSLTFSKPDNDASITEVSNSTILGNSVESPARTLSLISAPANGNRASCSPSTVATPASNALKPRQQHQQQQHQHQQQQLMLRQQQQQIMARTKPATGNANVTSTGVAAYTDRSSSCSSIAKFPNTLGIFPQAIIQGSPQSLQWKTAARAATPVPPSASATSSSSLKNPPHLGRNQHANNPPGILNHSSSIPVVHTQISFGPSPKNSANPPSMVGSPPTSVSKTGGSPSSRVSKGGTAPTVSQPKSSPPNSGQKSSPVAGRTLPSILGQSHMAQSKQQHQQQHQQVGLKTQQQQQQQQQVQKQAFQQNQLVFSNAFLQAQTQSPQSAAVYYQKPISSQGSFCNNNKSNTVQRRPSEQPQQQQNPSNNPNPSSNPTLSMCAPTLTLVGAPSDPTKAASLKGPPTVLHAQFNAPQSTANSPHPLMAATFPYIHTVPPVPLKPAEQKPAAGNDNLPACWQHEKR